MVINALSSSETNKKINIFKFEFLKLTFEPLIRNIEEAK